MSIEIIAEVAQGYEGNYKLSELLVQSAVNAGADAVKFQAVFADELATSNYQHYQLFKKLEMTREDWINIASHCKRSGIEFHLDVFGEKSISLADDLQIEAIKVHPTDMKNIALLEMIRDTAVPKVLLGIGGAEAQEISDAVDILATKQITLLLGFQGYPTETSENQIGRLGYLSERFRISNPTLRLGFADHAVPEEEMHTLLAALAIGAGATVIEKHLCLNRVLMLEDYESAINADEFKLYCDKLRETYRGIGDEPIDDAFLMSPAEIEYREAISRDVVAMKRISKGSTISKADVGLKRTGANLALRDLGKVIGSRSTREYEIDQVFLLSDLDQDNDK